MSRHTPVGGRSSSTILAPVRRQDGTPVPATDGATPTDVQNAGYWSPLSAKQAPDVWSPLTAGPDSAPELVFASGEPIMILSRGTGALGDVPMLVTVNDDTIAVWSPTP